MGDIKYLTGSAFGEGGGTHVLQEACICKENKNIPVIMAMVFSEHGEEQHSLAVEIGEWFQNSLVPMIKKNGADSLINVCMDGIGRKNVNSRLERTEYVCAIFAGETSALFKNGNTAGMYCIEELFGKPVTLPMEPGKTGIMAGVEGGGAIVLTDCDMTGDKFFAGEIAKGISSISDEKGLAGITREITNIESINCKSIVTVKFM